jgi:hypothetical protein
MSGSAGSSTTAPTNNQLKRAVVLGVALLGVVLVLVVLISGLLFKTKASYELPFAVGVLAEFVILVVALAGLVLVYNALGLSDGGSALGLPNGSVRALLALALVIVFIGACSTVLLSSATEEAKQILGISATAVTTIIGFYFGANSANDAFSAAQQSAGNTAPATQTPPTLDQVSRQAAAIKAIADALQQKLDVANKPDLDSIARSNPDPTALAALRDQANTCTAFVIAAGVDRDRAAQLVKDAAADASKIADAGAPMQHYASDAAKTQAGFDAALSAYTTARDALLTAQAKG